LIFNHLILLNAMRASCYNFGNGVRYQRVPWVITHVSVDGDFKHDRLISACSVYAVWTALRKFSVRIELALIISFLSFV